MQNPYQRVLAARATSGGSAGQAYDSFIDFEGFPTAAAGGSASYTSSPMSHQSQHSTAFMNDNNNWGNDNAVVDWPVEEDDEYIEQHHQSSPLQTSSWQFDYNNNNNRQQQNPQHNNNTSYQTTISSQPSRDKSIHSHAASISSSHNSNYSRDQQIFRRAPSNGSGCGGGNPQSHSSSSTTRGSAEEKRSSSNSGRGGGGGGKIIFESFEASTLNNNNNRSIQSDNFDGRSGSESILDNISKVAIARAALEGDGALNASQLRALNNQHSRQQQIHCNQKSNITSSNNKSFGSSPIVPSNAISKKQQLPYSPPEQQQQSTASSISPQSMIRKTGVVNKLVSIFSNKQQQQQQSNNQYNQSNQQRINGSSRNQVRAITTNTTSKPGDATMQYLKQTVAGVQFHIPTTATNKQQQQSQQNQRGTLPSSIPTNPNNTQSMATNYNNTNTNPPAISPSRSNAQSSVTGYSGDSSSYNPTGWPGTVDKKGRTYMMEPSYSESEGESLSSPQRQQRHSRPQHVEKMGEEEVQYPVQSYRNINDEELPQQKSISYDGDARKAQIETWLNGSAAVDETSQVAEIQSIQSRPIDLDEAYNNTYNERNSGPIDLDEAYERRFDTNMSETKTAADVQLEVALGMAKDQRSRRQTPNTSLASQHSYNAIAEEEAKLRGIDLSGSAERVRASGRRVPSPKIFNEEVDFDSSPNVYNSNNNDSYSQQHNKIVQQQQQQQLNDGGGRPQPLSEEALRWKDSQSAPPRAGGNVMLRGYRGFIDKTQDVPNLMDDLESEASMGTGIYSTNTDARRQHHAQMGLTLPQITERHGSGGLAASSLGSIVSSNVNIDTGSDVFDGIQEEPFGFRNDQQHLLWEKETSAHQQQKRQPGPHFGGEENMPYSTQFNPFTGITSQQPKQQSFLDPSLDISAVTRGSADVSHHIVDMENEDDFESLPDLSMYYVQPEMVRKMVRAFRKICTNQMEISSSEETMLYDFENLVDTKKAFALFEMRSRIMETDIDRGLERRGGTNVVDDIVLTPYFQAASRVRDAVIVSKAWRDGATPKDVTTAHLLTRRSAKAYFVRRPIHRIRRPGLQQYYDNVPEYWLEEVKWLDDTDFMLMRCQSLGAGTMKGFEMFTIGDCQSILLRMTSENCTSLRRELRSAMMRQIEAEELMKEEIDLDVDYNIVAEAEELFREATVEVKTLSIKLVLADKAFALVRNRMEKLVETIESLLVQIEDGDESDDEDNTSASMQSGDDESYISHEGSDDRQKLISRAKRAELSAEVAVREALMAKQMAEQINVEKQREIDNLKEKLVELETKSQLMASENRQQFYDGKANNASHFLDDAKSFLESTFDKSAEDAARKNRLKQQFRQRRALPKPKEDAEQKPQLRDEEILSHLDFYSRSLQFSNK